jgi:hypothetical protein
MRFRVRSPVPNARAVQARLRGRLLSDRAPSARAADRPSAGGSAWGGASSPARRGLARAGSGRSYGPRHRNLPDFGNVSRVRPFRPVSWNEMRRHANAANGPMGLGRGYTDRISNQAGNPAKYCDRIDRGSPILWPSYGVRPSLNDGQQIAGKTD